MARRTSGAAVLWDAALVKAQYEEAANAGLTIKLETAKPRGLTIPQALLLRADEVIQ